MFRARCAEKSGTSHWFKLSKSLFRTSFETKSLDSQIVMDRIDSSRNLSVVAARGGLCMMQGVRSKADAVLRRLVCWISLFLSEGSWRQFRVGATFDTKDADTSK